MKYRSLLFFGTIFTLLTAAFILPVNNAEKEAVLIQTILNGLDRMHFKPVAVDDNFSEKLYDLYLERLDGTHRWLTVEDLSKLESYKKDLDDEALRGTYEFFDVSVKLVADAQKKTQSYYREMLAQPFDFTKEETFEVDGEKRKVAKTDAELKETWRLMMKYETMTRLAEKLEAQKKGEDEELKDKTYAELEELARKDVSKLFDDWYERLGKLKRMDRLSTYLNAVTNIFDPHTGYFEPIDKQNFDIGMSGKLEGIGARLQTDGEYTKVTDVVVGGPAWKEGSLQENDKIVKVTQANGESIDITGMPINDVVQQIRGPKDTKVVLTVKKVNGSTEDITIVRDVVVMEEGFAKSLLINGEKGKKIGYIRLPRFYADFEDPSGRQCSTDVLKEIEKLKAQKVDGIILDLRSNGGGSLRDVVDMSGYFIEKGPIVQVKSRDRDPQILEDENKSVTYSGPLVIMVNTYSASASEILAAAMQDYKRAIIVGSPSTFGKGTVQRFFDLDRAVQSSDVKPLGEIKLTTQKFYRINGGSTQLKGVYSDIVLPDSYFYLETGEKDQDFPMEWTEIASVPYKQSVYEVKSLDKIRMRSEERVKKDASFVKIMENAKLFKDRRDNSAYSLKLTDYQATQAKDKALEETFDALMEEVVLGEVRNLEEDMSSFKGDESKVARNDEWLKEVGKDIYIKETIKILQDLMEFH